MIDIHALSGAYAVDALDDLERAEFEDHLEQCGACRVEVAGLREASTLLAETSAMTPPASLRASVLAEIATARPAPPVMAEVRALRSQRRASGRSPERERRWLPGLAAAAAVAAALVVGAAVTQPWDDGSSPGGSSQGGSTLSAADRVLGAPDAETSTQDVAGGGTAAVTRSAALKQAVVVMRDLPALPAGTVYQLWLQDRDRGLVPAGLTSSPDGTQVLDGDAANAVAAGITVEPDGGSPTPTLPPVALIAFAGA